VDCEETIRAASIKDQYSYVIFDFRNIGLFVFEQIRKERGGVTLKPDLMAG
jgi:hypothetical protein